MFLQNNKLHALAHTTDAHNILFLPQDHCWLECPSRERCDRTRRP